VTLKSRLYRGENAKFFALLRDIIIGLRDVNSSIRFRVNGAVEVVSPGMTIYASNARRRRKAEVLMEKLRAKGKKNSLRRFSIRG